MEIIYASFEIKSKYESEVMNLAPKKDRDPKPSRIEQEVLKEMEKAFGIKVYSNRQELKKALIKSNK